jgi:hypothetical protein
MEQKQLVKKVTEVEGLSAEELEKRKSFLCPICGKEEGILYLPNLICGVCYEHKTAWEAGGATQAWLYPLDVFLEMALEIYDHYYIDKIAREMIEGLDEIDLSDVAWTIGSIALPANPLWAGFEDAIRFAKEERMKREGEDSLEARKEHRRKEWEEKGRRCSFIDGYGREVDKDGNLLRQKEIPKENPSSSPQAL